MIDYSDPSKWSYEVDLCEASACNGKVDSFPAGRSLECITVSWQSAKKLAQALSEETWKDIHQRDIVNAINKYFDSPNIVSKVAKALWVSEKNLVDALEKK